MPTIKINSKAAKHRHQIPLHIGIVQYIADVRGIQDRGKRGARVVGILGMKMEASRVIVQGHG